MDILDGLVGGLVCDCVVGMLINYLETCLVGYIQGDAFNWTPLEKLELFSLCKIPNSNISGSVQFHLQRENNFTLLRGNPVKRITL